MKGTWTETGLSYQWMIPWEEIQMGRRVLHSSETATSKLPRLLKGYVRTGKGALLMQWNLVNREVCN